MSTTGGQFTVDLARCLDLVQDFCIVTESVRGGIAVDVEVTPQLEATSVTP